MTARAATSTVTPHYWEDEVLLDEVAEEQWRVLDARLPKEDVAALRGFVRIFAGLYEVTTMARPQEIVYCADLHEVHATFADLPATEPNAVISISAHRDRPKQADSQAGGANEDPQTEEDTASGGAADPPD
ncbi:MAG TPA: hypothetical protein VLZ78_07955 [Terrimesophilobacter sp.]|nr:hypothetical protein [Terrimesophilobacter sp.]